MSEAGSAALPERWDGVYRLGDTTRSWYQAQPEYSLRTLDVLGVPVSAGVIDVGGGASTLADALIGRGFSDLTVLDVSREGQDAARRRLGPDAARVNWLTGDVLGWRPERRYELWHDRALFHFLTDAAGRRRYLETLKAATGPGSVLIIATFAADGPDHCSGLPTARYAPTDLAEAIGSPWNVVYTDREQHVTPNGGIQPFTWVAFRRGPKAALRNTP